VLRHTVGPNARVSARCLKAQAAFDNRRSAARSRFPASKKSHRYGPDFRLAAEYAHRVLGSFNCPMPSKARKKPQTINDIVTKLRSLVESLRPKSARFAASPLGGFAEQKAARGVVGDGQRVAIPSIAEPEFALEISALELVGRGARRERRSGGAMARGRSA
jgi:hypothetical protein